MNQPLIIPPSRLIRALGPFTAMAVVVGTIIGSGIFKKPQEIAEALPYSGLAAGVWVLGGVLAFLGALALAEVAVLYPQAGGNYVYLREGYGRLAGFLWGWVEFWIIRGAALAALATVFTESLHDVLRNSYFQRALALDLGPEPLSFWAQRGLTVTVILTLAAVNVRGVRWGGGLQLFITVVKMASLLGIALLPFGLALWLTGNADTPQPHTRYLQPVWPSLHGFVLAGFGTALLAVLWSYHGWMSIVPLAEEVKHPQRNLPLALLGGTLVVIVLYLAVNLAYFLVIPQQEMQTLTDTTVATVFSERLLGPIGAAVASAAVMISVFGALNGNILIGPRVLYAMGEDHLAPKVLGAVHVRYHTPALAILVMAGWASILVLAAAALIRYRLPTLPLGSWTLDVNVPYGKSLFNILTNFAMFGAIAFETLAVASIYIFRWRWPDVQRPYRCPGYPWVPAIFILVSLFVLVNMFVEQRTEALAGVAFVVGGAVIYALWYRDSAPPDPGARTAESPAVSAGAHAGKDEPS